MKRLSLFVLCLLSVAVARAYDYNYLVIETSDGNSTSVNVSSLVMTVANGTLSASNGTQNRTFAVGDLHRMYFSSSTTGISDTQATTDTDDSIEVYTTEGIKVGTFDSMPSALETLAKGIYIYRTQGRTSKITIR